MGTRHIPATQAFWPGALSCTSQLFRLDRLFRSGRFMLAGASMLCCVLFLLYCFSPLPLAAQDISGSSTSARVPDGTSAATSAVSLGFTQPPATEETTPPPATSPAPLHEETQSVSSAPVPPEHSAAPLTPEQPPAPRAEEPSPAPLAAVEQRLPPLPDEAAQSAPDTVPDTVLDAAPAPATTPTGTPTDASATAPAKGAVTKDNKRLFGTIEMRASIKELHQWQDVQKRHKENPIFVQGFKLNASTTWDKLKSMLQDKPALEKLRGVNSFWNQWPYKLDKAVYGKEDYWAAPYEFRKNSGDCEDYAIAKYYTLKELGFSVEQMRIVVLKDTILNVAHAILAVYLDDDIYILDNIAKNVLSHTRIRNYLPVYSVNEQYRWVHMRTSK